VNLYAESSAVLAWLLLEREGLRVDRLLTAAESVISSDLTLIECDRALLRAAATGRLSATEASDRKRELSALASAWSVLRISPEIVERARRPFPVETIRALDAIHLASALVARAATPFLEILTLDDRIREVARDLGLKIQPR
jgi:predicted nucleic acid-binding protein